MHAIKYYESNKYFDLVFPFTAHTRANKILKNLIKSYDEDVEMVVSVKAKENPYFNLLKTNRFLIEVKEVFSKTTRMCPDVLLTTVPCI
jgi:hypothetical protein